MWWYSRLNWGISVEQLFWSSSPWVAFSPVTGISKKWTLGIFVPEQVSQNKSRYRSSQMSTIQIQLFFSKSFSFSLQTYINMRSLILDQYALRLYKDNWFCTSCVLLPRCHYQPYHNQVFSRALVLLLLTEGFCHIQFELSPHGYSAPDSC